MSLIRFLLPGVENRALIGVDFEISFSILRACRICAISNITKGSRSSNPLACRLARILAAWPSWREPSDVDELVTRC